MQHINEREDRELIQTMLLRSMKQAVYNADNAGHFGLALKRYAHFTSPIRRYPDLLLHRAIKYLIAKEGGRNSERWTPTGGYHYTFDDMDFYGEQCSMTERRADDATREVNDWLKCEYMQDHVGEVMDGVIANVTGFGFFVRLTELHIDGLVHISALANDYYQFDAVGQRLVGESSGNIYRLGDSVKVKVSAVNLETRQIDFDLEDTDRQPRGKGKTAKKRAAEAMKKAKSKKRSAVKSNKPGVSAKPMVEPTKRPDGSSEGPAKKKKPANKTGAAKARAKKKRAASRKPKADKS